MNAIRYKHFKVTTSTESPFNHGCFRNTIDFFEFRCCGLFCPVIADWTRQCTTEYDQIPGSGYQLVQQHLYPMKHIAKWCLKIVSVRVSLALEPTSLEQQQAVCRANGEFHSLFFQYFISKSKHGQSTLPLLGRIMIIKVLMALNVGIYNILTFWFCSHNIFHEKSELILLTNMAY